MPINSLKGLVATFAGALMLALAGCSTPCDAPGRLCAPIESNTSAQPSPHPRTELPAPAATPGATAPGATAPGASAPGATAPGATAPGATAPGASAPFETRPVEPPGIGANLRETRIGLMLPLRSEALGAPADALRAGFMAAHERDREGFTVNLIETGDSPQETIDAYAAASRQNDIMVGPLARPAASALVRKPTIALNHPEALAGAAALPARMLVIGLSIEDEARQVANWAGFEHPGGPALIISGASAWQRRIAASFAARWKQLGYASQMLVLSDSNGYLSEAALGQLRAQFDAAQPALVFAALDSSQAGQVRGALGADLPMYGTSSVNPGANAGANTGANTGANAGANAGSAVAELDGLRLLDLPWEVDSAHPAVMAYPRWNGAGRTLDMDRLYALGIDAYRVAREIALRPGADFRLDGVTGRLSVSFGNGPARFERIEPAAVYEGGGFTLVPDGR
jgi:outer membrane PBP1 activator LpoA protein